MPATLADMSPNELLLSPMAYMPPARSFEGLNADQSAARVPGAPHSIVEIVAHIVFWQSWSVRRCEGSAEPMAASAATGWPAASAADWESLRSRFLADAERLVAMTSDPTARMRRLEPPIESPPLAEYTVGDAAVHVAVHNAHHLGQIVTLRQMLGAWPPPQGSWTW